MSTATQQSPVAEQAKRNVTMCKESLLRTFSFVPDEKLTWVPQDGCRSALRIVAHCAISNASFIGIMNGVPFPEGREREELFAAAREKEKSIATREEAIALLESSSADVIAAIDALTPEQIESEVSTPIFTAPMVFWMNLPGRHMDNHASQIDYLQTCWGDTDWHM